MTDGYGSIEDTARKSASRTFASLDALARGWWDLVDETGSYSRRAFEDSANHVDKLLGAPTLDAALNAQGQYLRVSFARVAGQAARLGEIWLGAVSDAAKPFHNRRR
jgi:hypothetical protein